MKIYLDSNNICHPTYKEGYTEAEHPYFDSVCTEAINCYKFIPERDFIQCFDSRRADMAQASHDKAVLVQQIADVIEEVYEADVAMIGE